MIVDVEETITALLAISEVRDFSNKSLQSFVLHLPWWAQGRNWDWHHNKSWNIIKIFARHYKTVHDLPSETIVTINSCSAVSVWWRFFNEKYSVYRLIGPKSSSIYKSLLCSLFTFTPNFVAKIKGDVWSRRQMVSCRSNRWIRSWFTDEIFLANEDDFFISTQ